MSLGLNEKELDSMLLFGKDEKEIMLNIFGTTENIKISNTSLIIKIAIFILNKVFEVMIANNKRIEEQLNTINIKLNS